MPLVVQLAGVVRDQPGEARSNGAVVVQWRQMFSSSGRGQVVHGAELLHGAIGTGRLEHSAHWVTFDTIDQQVPRTIIGHASKVEIPSDPVPPVPISDWLGGLSSGVRRSTRRELPGSVTGPVRRPQVLPTVVVVVVEVPLTPRGDGEPTAGTAGLTTGHHRFQALALALVLGPVTPGDGAALAWRAASRDCKTTHSDCLTLTRPHGVVMSCTFCAFDQEKRRRDKVGRLGVVCLTTESEHPPGVFSGGGWSPEHPGVRPAPSSCSCTPVEIHHATPAGTGSRSSVFTHPTEWPSLARTNTWPSTSPLVHPTVPTVP